MAVATLHTEVFSKLYQQFFLTSLPTIHHSLLLNLCSVFWIVSQSLYIPAFVSQMSDWFCMCWEIVQTNQNLVCFLKELVNATQFQTRNFIFQWFCLVMVFMQYNDNLNYSLTQLYIICIYIAHCFDKYSIKNETFAWCLAPYTWTITKRCLGFPNPCNAWI